MLTFAEQLALLEAKVAQVSGLNLKQLDELASYVSRVSAMTGLSVEDVTQILQNASAHTGISMSELAKTLEDLVLEIKEKGGEEEMAIRYKEIGNYKGKPVREVSLNDYITLLLDREAKDDVYYVITENLSVVLNEWVIGRINNNRRNITEVKHVSVRTVFSAEITRRTPRQLSQKMTSNSQETLISARPAVAAFMKDGENKLKEQARRGRELVESLKRPVNG